MLISPPQLRRYFGVKPTGVLHVGAHLAEEARLYELAGFGSTIWVEANPDLCDRLRERLDSKVNTIFEGVAWSEDNQTLNFNITNNTQSSSLFELAAHKKHYPSIVVEQSYSMQTVKLETLLPADSRFDFVNIDIQGAELEALKGLGKLTSKVSWFYLEVNREALYEGIPMVSEIDEFLRGKGFTRIVTAWTGEGWGDALYASSSNNSLGLLFWLLAGKVYEGVRGLKVTVKRARRQARRLTRKLKRFSI